MKCPIGGILCQLPGPKFKIIHHSLGFEAAQDEFDRGTGQSRCKDPQAMRPLSPTIHSTPNSFTSQTSRWVLHPVRSECHASKAHRHVPRKSATVSGVKSDCRRSNPTSVRSCDGSEWFLTLASCRWAGGSSSTYLTLTEFTQCRSF